MNADKIQDISTEDLCRMADNWIEKALKSYPHSFSLHIPAEGEDYDVLFTELIRRLRATVDPMDGVRDSNMGKERADLP